jgi:hypothetical protein
MKQPHLELPRIIKAFEDAQWLAELNQKLEQNQAHAAERGK